MSLVRASDSLPRTRRSMYWIFLPGLRKSDSISGIFCRLAPWNPNTAYVTWHSSGEDKAWFLSDGTTGWYRIGVTPSPEQGVTISPFATIVGGAEAVQSIETSPGVHQLLVGPANFRPDTCSQSYATFRTTEQVILGLQPWEATFWQIPDSLRKSRSSPRTARRPETKLSMSVILG